MRYELFVLMTDVDDRAAGAMRSFDETVDVRKCFLTPMNAAFPLGVDAVLYVDDKQCFHGKGFFHFGCQRT